GRRRHQALLIQLRQDERIQPLLGPGAVFSSWHRWIGDGLERPELPVVRRDFEAGVLVRWANDRGGLRPLRSLLDPGCERGDLRGIELPLRRHLRFVFVIDRFDEQTLLRVAGDDGRAGVAVLQHGVARIKAQAARVLLPAVTFEAVVHEDWPNRFLEELVGGGRGWIGGAGGGQAEPATDQNDREGPATQHGESLGSTRRAGRRD